MTEYSKTAKCLYCGKEFDKSTSRHKYCSSRCKEAYRISKLELHEGTCKGCGKPITYKINRQAQLEAEDPECYPQNCGILKLAVLHESEDGFLESGHTPDCVCRL